MATTPSNPIVLQASSAARVESGFPVMSVGGSQSIPNQRSPRTAGRFALPGEPEDARLTGGTRSLDRRLLALNLVRVRPSADAA